MTLPKERELKLSVPSAFRLPTFEDLDGLRAVELAPQTYRATYYDTADLRLARWGVTLRYRTSDGWTVKLPDSEASSILARIELRFEGGARHPPPAAVDVVGGYLRGGTLEPVARLRIRRRAIDLFGADGAPRFQVVDDEVATLDGRRIAQRFREVELEITGESGATGFDAVRAQLREAGAEAASPTPKVFRALGARALEPPDIVVSSLARDSSAAAALQHAIAASALRLLRHDPVVRLDADIEGVHQMRVATRRLRSDLRTFASLLEEEWATSLIDELLWLARLLGNVRDADVMLLRFQNQKALLSQPASDAVASVLRSLRSTRRRALQELLDALRSERYIALLDSLAAAAQAPAFTSAADGSGREVLPSLVRQPWRSLRRTAQALGKQSTDEELHDLRIKAKRCRYAAEAVAPVMGKRATSFAAAAAQLQDALGEHNDAVVAEQWLRDWASRRRSVDTAFAAGELAGLERALGLRQRRRWRSAWRKLDSPKLRSWL